MFIGSYAVATILTSGHILSGKKSVSLSLLPFCDALRLIIHCRNNSVSACIEFKFDVQTFRRCHVRVTRRPNGTGAENKEISAFSGNVRMLLATGP